MSQPKYNVTEQLNNLSQGKPVQWELIREDLMAFHQLGLWDVLIHAEKVIVEASISGFKKRKIDFYSDYSKEINKTLKLIRSFR